MKMSSTIISILRRVRDNDYGQMARGTTVLGSYQLADDGHWIH